MYRDVYSGYLKLDGEEHETPSEQPATTRVPYSSLERYEEAKSLLRKTMPVARRVLGENHDLTLKMRWITRARSTRTPPPRSTISASRERRSRRRNGPRGACSVARTHSRRRLSQPGSARIASRPPRGAPFEVTRSHKIHLTHNHSSRPDRRDANARADAAADFRRPTRLRGGNVGGASPSSDASDGGADEYWEARSGAGSRPSPP